jgi:hypothetical protein
MEQMVCDIGQTYFKQIEHNGVTYYYIMPIMFPSGLAGSLLIDILDYFDVPLIGGLVDIETFSPAYFPAGYQITKFGGGTFTFPENVERLYVLDWPVLHPLVPDIIQDIAKASGYRPYTVYANIRTGTYPDDNANSARAKYQDTGDRTHIPDGWEPVTLTAYNGWSGSGDDWCQVNPALSIIYGNAPINITIPQQYPQYYHVLQAPLYDTDGWEYHEYGGGESYQEMLESTVRLIHRSMAPRCYLSEYPMDLGELTIDRDWCIVTYSRSDSVNVTAQVLRPEYNDPLVMYDPGPPKRPSRKYLHVISQHLTSDKLYSSIAPFVCLTALIIDDESFIVDDEPFML